jgi:hypothetical protein
VNTIERFAYPFQLCSLIPYIQEGYSGHYFVFRMAGWARLLMPDAHPGG